MPSFLNGAAIALVSFFVVLAGLAFLTGSDLHPPEPVGSAGADGPHPEATPPQPPSAPVLNLTAPVHKPAPTSTAPPPCDNCQTHCHYKHHRWRCDD